MALPKVIRVTRFRTITEQDNSQMRNSVQIGDVAHLRALVQSRNVVDHRGGQNLLHKLPDVGDYYMKSEVMDEMFKEGILTVCMNQQCIGSRGIPVLVEGTDPTENSYVWFHAEVDRASFLGLEPGQLVNTDDIQHIISHGYNGLRDIDVQTALEKTPVVHVPDTSPMACAVIKGDKKLVELFIQYGNQIDQVDANGNTPAMLAAAAGHLGILVILVENRASLRAFNDQRKSASMIAQENHHYAVKNYIDFELSPLRINIMQLNTGYLSEAVRTFQSSTTVENAQQYWLHHASRLRQHIEAFLGDNFVQDMNLTSLPSVDAPQTQQRQFTPMAVVSGSYSDCAQVFLTHLSPIHFWITHGMVVEHRSGVNMVGRIYSILDMLLDDVNTFIRSLL